MPGMDKNGRFHIPKRENQVKIMHVPDMNNITNMSKMDTSKLKDTRYGNSMKQRSNNGENLISNNDGYNRFGVRRLNVVRIKSIDK